MPCECHADIATPAVGQQLLHLCAHTPHPFPSLTLSPSHLRTSLSPCGRYLHSLFALAHDASREVQREVVRGMVQLLTVQPDTLQPHIYQVRCQQHRQGSEQACSMTQADDNLSSACHWQACDCSERAAGLPRCAGQENSNANVANILLQEAAFGHAVHGQQAAVHAILELVCSLRAIAH
jgi:hypothetical protein